MTASAADFKLGALAAGVLGVLVFASIVGYILRLKTTSERGREVVLDLNARIKAWWVMAIIFLLAIATGSIGSLVLFGLISFLALREYITLTPTQRADHRVLFLGLFRHHSAAVHFDRHSLVRFIQYFHPSVRLPAHTYSQRDRGRLQGLSGPQRQDSMGVDGMRLFR
jgi:predicted CDP-diglyceride synthetase/phosphatidate cytidylyltransferase